MGGAKGRLLTNSVRSVHSEFQQAAQRFHTVGGSRVGRGGQGCDRALRWPTDGLDQPLCAAYPTTPPHPPTPPCPQVDYDVLDVDEQRFAEDFGQFKRVVQDLERRLASIIMQVGARAGGGWLGWRRAGGGTLPSSGCCTRWHTRLHCVRCTAHPHPRIPTRPHPGRALTSAPPSPLPSSSSRALRAWWSATPSAPTWSASTQSSCAPTWLSCARCGRGWVEGMAGWVGAGGPG